MQKYQTQLKDDDDNSNFGNTEVREKLLF